MDVFGNFNQLFAQPMEKSFTCKKCGITFEALEQKGSADGMCVECSREELGMYFIAASFSDAILPRIMS